jgi:hypothetical protein
MTVSSKKATDPKGWIKEDGPNLEKKQLQVVTSR